MLQVNICFYASESYKKVIYLNVSKSLQLFWCFQMRMRTSFVNLVRLLPSEDKSHKWHLSHPIVYSCCCYFFKISSVRIPNLLLYVLVNTSAMHFLCLSFTVGLIGIKRRASRIASSIEIDTFVERYSIITDIHWSIWWKQWKCGKYLFFCALLSRSPNACPRSPMGRKKITPVLQERQGVLWHSQQQVID